MDASMDFASRVMPTSEVDLSDRLNVVMNGRMRIISVEAQTNVGGYEIASANT